MKGKLVLVLLLAFAALLFFGTGKGEAICSIGCEDVPAVIILDDGTAIRGLCGFCSIWWGNHGCTTPLLCVCDIDWEGCRFIWV